MAVLYFSNCRAIRTLLAVLAAYSFIDPYNTVKARCSFTTP
jgi:hypothetical protein